MSRSVYASALLIALFACLPLASAQPPGGGEVNLLEYVEAAAPGYFYKVERGEPVITVTAVGAIASNAVFLLGEGATVGDLIALAGGVLVDRTGQAKVRLHRQGTTVAQIEIQDLYSEGGTSPVLQNGDVVEVVGLTSSVPGFFVHTEPGTEAFSVTASGAFASPGRYLLDTGSTVGDLVAYAGGLGSIGARDSRTDVEATVRVYRAGEVLLESPLNALYAQQTMALQPGDAVDLEVITTRRGSFWRDALSVTTATLSAILLIDRILE